MSIVPQVRFLDRTTPPHLSTLILLAGVSALSMTLFLPSLPNMTRYFETEYRLIQLSVAVYLFVNAALQVVVGPISDRFGRRPVVLWAIALFIVATAGCMLAPNVEVFLAFRMAQAVVATGMVLSRAIVRDIVPQEQAASIIGYVTMGMALAPMLGPVAGGILDESFGWKANFAFLIILGLAIYALCHFDLGETATSRPSSLRQQMQEYPELFSSRRFWGYCLVSTFASGAFFAYLGGAPFVGSDVYGLSPSALGIYFGVAAFGYMLGNFISGRYSIRVGINRMVLLGTATTIIGPGATLVLTLIGYDNPTSFFGLMVFVGIGNGMTLPNAMAGMLSVRPHLAGSASGIGGAMVIGGGSCLSALSGSMLSAATGAYPLIGIMLASEILGVVAALYVIWIERLVNRQSTLEN